MNFADAQKLVEAEWRRVYPDDGGWVRVTEIVPNTFGGSLVAIKSEDKEGVRNEELVYIFDDSRVRVFGSTDELACFLEMRSMSKVVRIISNQSFIKGAVFLLLILAIFTVGFWKETYSREALAALSSVLGAAAGFFFASKKTDQGQL